MPEMQKGKDINSINNVIDISKEWNKWKGGKEGGDKRKETEYGPPITWYRGQPQDWPLRSGVYRRKTFIKQACEEYKKHRTCQDKDNPAETASINFYEELTIIDYMRAAAPFFPENLSFVEKYFIAQHYKYPTRLLDWTVNPLIALYFACEDKKAEDGWLYVIDPKEFIPQRPDVNKILQYLEEKKCEFKQNIKPPLYQWHCPCKWSIFDGRISFSPFGFFLVA